MCGTIGTIGSKAVVPPPIDRLKRLECRGNGWGNAREAAACGGWVILFTDAPDRDPIGECNVRAVELPAGNHVLAPAPHARTRLPAYQARWSKAPASNSRAPRPSR
jgi:hypothetical protein